MTHLEATLMTEFVKPVSVALGEMAVAAAFRGVSLTLCYRDYPAPLLCQLWKYFAQSVEPAAVHHIHGHANIRKIPGRVDDLRIVFVHSPRHCIATAWAVQMATPDSGTACPRPAIFSHGAIEDADADPGATILLRCDAAEHEAITRWIAAGERLPANWAAAASATTSEQASVVASADLLDRFAGEGWPHEFRDREILRGFLAGSRVLRSLGDSYQAEASPASLLADYALVRSYLQSPIICPIDDCYDALAVHMVNRANVYLGIKFGDDSTEHNPFYATSLPGYRAPRYLTTRKEIADLGNTRSRTVRELVGYLQRAGNGYVLFDKLGLVGPAPRRNDWRRSSVQSLTSLLVCWSIKQVRTSFERLQRTGLVVAEREQANGPWLYALPEDLTHCNNPFRALPAASEIGELPDGQ